MSTTRMMILGLVRWLEPVHGYEVRRELISWNVEELGEHRSPARSTTRCASSPRRACSRRSAPSRSAAGRPARRTGPRRSGGRSSTGCCASTGGSYRQPVDPFAAGVLVPARAAAAGGGRGAAQPRRRAARHVVQMREALDRVLAGREAGSRALDAGADRGAPEAEIAWCERVAARIEAGEGQHEGEEASGGLAVAVARGDERDAAGSGLRRRMEPRIGRAIVKFD